MEGEEMLSECERGAEARASSARIGESSSETLVVRRGESIAPANSVNMVMDP